MYEHSSEPLAPPKVFARRLILALSFGAVLVVVSVIGGVLGHHEFGQLSWSDAFVHTCMLLGDHDSHLYEGMPAYGKVFSGLYLLYARLVFVTLVVSLFLPVLHRMLHKLHLDDED